jgi:hypothetical protein
MVIGDERRVEVLFISLGSYRLRKECYKGACQILEWKKDLLILANYMVFVT